MEFRTQALGAYLASFGARAIRSIGRVGVLLLAARLYPIALVGEFAFALAIGTLLGGVSDLGVTNYLQRELGARGFVTANLERTALKLRLATAFASLLCAWSLMEVIGIEGTRGALGTIIFTLSVAVSDSLASLRRARGRFDLESLEVAPVFILSVLCALLAEVVGLGFAGFQAGLAVGAVLSVLVRCSIMWMDISRRMTTPGEGVSIPHLVATTRWFWLTALAILALFELPVILLRALSDAEAVALYATAMRAVGLVSQPLLVLGSIFIPSMALQARENRGLFQRAVSDFNSMYLLALPAGIAAAVLGGILLLSGFGAEYLKATTVLWILTGGVMIYIGPPYVGPLYVVEEEKPIAFATTIAVAVAVATCFVLIPLHAAVGAAFSVTLGFLVAKVGHVFLYAKRHLPILDRHDFAVSVIVLGWILACYLTDGHLSVGLLLVGGTLASLATVLRLRRTPLYGLTQDSATE